MNTTAVKWLKKIFSVQTITVLGTLVTIIIAYLAFIQDKSGTLAYEWSEDRKQFQNTGQPVPEKLQYFCFYGSVAPEQLNEAFLFPILTNVSNRQVKGLNVSYSTKLYNCSLDLQSGYSSSYSRVNEAYIIEYEDDALPAFKSLEPPFDLVNAQSYPNCLQLTASVSYDGIKEPIHLNYTLYNIHIKPEDTPDPDAWRMACLKAAAANASAGCDIYLYLNGKDADNNMIETLGPYSAEELETLAALEVFPSDNQN